MNIFIAISIIIIIVELEIINDNLKNEVRKWNPNTTINQLNQST